MKKIAFENTEVAFRGRSNAELQRTYWLFRAMNNAFLAKFGPGLTQLALKIGLPIIPLIRSTIFRHFCGGETIEDSEKVIISLSEHRTGSILDYSVEGEQEEKVFRETAEEIMRTIKRAQGDVKIPFAVFKVTGIGRFGLLEKVAAGAALTVAEDAEFFKLKARVNQICREAYDRNVRIMIDAEESWIQEPIDNLAIAMMRQYNREKAIVYNTYQLYLKNKLNSLKEDLATARSSGFILGAKLVRGAYMEKERDRAAAMNYLSPVQDDKAGTDAHYNEALEICSVAADHIALVAGTHNEQSCSRLVELMELHQIPADHPHFYFAQLLGMGDHISFNLAYKGYNVAKYVPYGPVKSVLPYLFRRAEENSSIAGHTGRELKMIVKERRRRRR